MKGPAFACALALALLPACQHRSGANDLVSQILFTASGSYDRSADQRTREGSGIRQVVWKSKPPFSAQAVTVRYDSDQRVQGWQMQIVKPGFEVVALGSARQVATPRGQVTVLDSPRLKDVVAWQDGDRLWLESRGYVVQHDAGLVGVFR